jgi:hypothetical protein
MFKEELRLLGRHFNNFVGRRFLDYVSELVGRTSRDAESLLMTVFQGGHGTIKIVYRSSEPKRKFRSRFWLILILWPIPLVIP